MSPILDMQRSGREIGRIRIGAMVTAANGKARPTKLDTFRLTTPARSVADAVGGLLGGEVRRWSPQGGGAQQWEVVTQATELPVIVPPGDEVISQDYEMWSAGGCVRRCDGFRATLYAEDGKTRSDCVCPPAGEERVAAAAMKPPTACKPTTRVNVMLPDLPGLGVWRIESRGYWAAVELGGDAELLRRAREAGVLLPALLRLEQRQVKRLGKPRYDFGVPILDLGIGLRQLAAVGGSEEMARALPPAPVRALTAGPSTTSGAAPGPDAQQLADLAGHAATAEQVLGVGRQARERGLLEESISDADGVMESLDSYLRARLAELQAPAGPDEPLHYSQQEIAEGAS